MPDHTKIRAWQRAQTLTVSIADSLSPAISRRMPGLRRQILKASASIAANIAEGAAQKSPAQYSRYLDIAIGSASETESHLDLAVRLDVVAGDGDALLREIQIIRRMTFRLRERVDAAAQ
ncbi:MAG: four helix bundle protein [Gemmatimonadaceae bacterium]|jgi:four helix bundle protein|nr:four helix bundle protein [Gemmatimonadaceae bacterium]